ncbi:MAG: SPASM domain-containing protein [Desulfobulbaceae bacterium]|nr:SPASM domain-containing protein [Desulfobulbaceae bacterium]
MKKYKKIYIEITNRCNLSCSFCLPSNRPKAFMALEDFAKIVRQAKFHTDHLSLHVLGEPLLHPDLGQILDLCYRYGLQVNLTTNATLLGRRQDVLLTSPALRQVNISLHSFENDEPSSGIRAYLANIFDFISKATESHSFYICLRLWNIIKGADPDISLRRQTLLRQLEAFFSLPFELADDLTPGQGITLAPRVFLSQNPRFTWPHADAPEMGAIGTCRGARDHVAILVDGTVVPCCLDAEADINLGNIHTQPFSAILESPRVKALRQGFLQQRLVESLCRRCTFRVPSSNLSF